MGVIMKPLPLKDEDESKVDKTESDPVVKAEESIDCALCTLSAEDKVIETETEIVHKSMEETVEEKAAQVLHSRKFRAYCDHMLSPDLNTTIGLLMADLIRFQDKQYQKDPDKARAKRRFVVGLREVAKFLKVKKIQAIILAPDIEKVETEGGLDDAVTKLIKDAGLHSVKVIFGLNRYKLGRMCLKKVPISVIGILNYQGSNEHFNSMLSQVETLREQYKLRLAEEIEKIKNPLPVSPSIMARPSSVSSSVLSHEAAEFVPSFAVQDTWQACSVADAWQYQPYYNNMYENQLTYNDFHSSTLQGPSNDVTGEAAGNVWGNMLNILKN